MATKFVARFPSEGEKIRLFNVVRFYGMLKIPTVSKEILEG
jgi:hypothetical protein